MVSKCRSPIPWISVWPSSELYSKWKVGSSSCSLWRPAASLSSSPRCFTSTAEVATASGRGRGGRRTGSVALAEGVPGVGVAQLGHRADVAGIQPLDLDPLLALLDREVVQLLGRLVLRVPDLLAVPELAAVEPEQGDVADVRLGEGLEHPAHQRRLDRRLHFRGRGKQLDHLLEQRPEPVGERRAAAEERHDLAGEHRPLHARR